MARGEEVFYDTELSLSQPSPKEAPATGEPTPGPIQGEEFIEIIEFTPPTAITEDSKEDDGKKDTVETPEEKKTSEEETADAQEEETEKSAEETPSESSSSSSYSAFAKVLYEEGVLTQFDEAEFEKLVEEQGAVSALVELNKRTIADIVQGQLESLPEDYRQVIAAAQQGVPLRKALDYVSRSMDYGKITAEHLEKDEALAESLFKESLSARGFTEEEIEGEVQEAKDLDKLQSKAASALKFLQKHYHDQLAKEQKIAEEMTQQARKRQEEDLKTLQGNIANLEKLVPGVKITKERQGKLYDMLTKPVKQVEGRWLTGLWAKRAEDPLKFDAVLAYMVDSGLFDGKLDSLMKQARSEAAQSFEKLIGVSAPDLHKGGKPVPVQKQSSVSKQDILQAAKQFQRKPR